MPNSLIQLNDELHSGVFAATYRMDETALVNELIEMARFAPHLQAQIHDQAAKLVGVLREHRVGKGGLDAFLFQYDLSSAEGIALMCLAEALLRIPDKVTVDRLIKDKITQADWDNHLGQSSSMFVNAATWALMLTGKILTPEGPDSSYLKSTLKKMTTRSGEPVIRKAVVQAIRIMSRQFVMGRTISEAIQRAKTLEVKGYRYSYDMLGEAAYTSEDAERYFKSYVLAIQEVAKVSPNASPIESPGISVKLSALHPRYDIRQRERVLNELLPKLKALAKLAKDANIGLTIDAEESHRLSLSLELIEAVMMDSDFAGWDGFGLAVQAYQKRAIHVVDWLIDKARQYNRRIMIRLVKGAYWDTEIKDTQVNGYKSYPVFTRKVATDVSYLACMKKLLDARDAVYPQFATHNAHTLAAVMAYARNNTGYEFQCLHGMGEALYEQVVGCGEEQVPCRIYAPVGTHEDLLAYLVRRLLENGANSSFVNRIVDESLPISEIIADPSVRLAQYEHKPHPCIPLPVDLYGDERPNSLGIDLMDVSVFRALQSKVVMMMLPSAPVRPSSGEADPMAIKITNPADISMIIGEVYEGNEVTTKSVIDVASQAFPTWSKLPVEFRANYIITAAERLIEHRDELLQLLIREAGKTWSDAIAEFREAVDFCYYYAAEAKKQCASRQLQGPTGEMNLYSLHGRGVVACISPWNFPLAIFLGQVVAALVTGNTVVSKPAEQTPFVAQKALDCFYQAGLPREVLQLLPGRGEVVGPVLISDQRIKAVMFTGSTEVAKLLQRDLAMRPGAIIPLIAETGGQNTMIVDSSALPEQVTVDVIQSAFQSAGQRCSALRVLYVQDDIADKVIRMIKGAMQEQRVGDPIDIATDIGPVIDQEALSLLRAHKDRMIKEGRLIYDVSAPLGGGHFFGPCAFEIDSIKCLEKEIFGPILHIVRFKASNIDQVIKDINDTGYGLTLGVHSRIKENIDYIVDRVHVGNIYVNRNIVGAVVGVQPFGGDGLSGTGPKAGGPHYLARLSTERSISVNTTAAGGNASLMAVIEG